MGIGSGDLDRLVAERIVRFLWVAFNNAGLYGGKHPLTVRALNDCAANLVGVLQQVSPATLFVEQDSLVFEDFKISDKAYNPRLIARLKGARVQSITFSRGTDLAVLSEVVRILADGEHYPDLASLSGGLHQAGIQTVRFNYITFQKVTADESVVVRGSDPRPEPVRSVQTAIPPVVMPAGDVAPEPAPPRRPVSAAQPARDPSPAPQPVGAIIGKLRAIRDRVKSYDPSRALPSSDEVIETLTLLRKNVLDDLKVEESVSRIGTVEEKALDELESLTFEVVLRIIRDEYRAGTVSVKRLGQILRRLVPDVREIKQLLPLLKRELLQEGMPLADYLALMQDLARDLEGDGLLDLLKDAGEEIGVSVDEILGDARKDPRTAVRLIVLAAQFGALDGDREKFGTLIDSYVGRVCAELGAAAGTTGPGSDAVSRLEQELASQLEQLGLDGGVNSPTRDRASTAQVEKAPDVSPDQAIPPPLPGPDLGAVRSEEKTPLTSAPDTDAATAAAQPVSDAPLSLAAGKNRTGPQFPKQVLRPRETKWNIDREIKRGIRYASPFSCVVLSVEGIDEPDPPRTPEIDELQSILDSVCASVCPTMRDLDMMGTAGSLDGKMALVLLLTMTDEKGAECVQGRLKAQLAVLDVKRNGIMLRPRLAVSVTAFDREKTPDLPSFLRLLRANHRKASRAGTA